MKPVFFLPTIYRHESRDDLIANLKIAVGLDTTAIHTVDRIELLPKGTTVIVDALFRLGENADKVATNITRILEHCDFWIPSCLDLRR